MSYNVFSPTTNRLCDLPDAPKESKKERRRRILRSRLPSWSKRYKKEVYYEDTFLDGLVGLTSKEERSITSSLKRLLSSDISCYNGGLSMKKFEDGTSHSPSGCSIASGARDLRFTFDPQGSTVTFFEAGHHTHFWKSEG